MKKQNLMNKRIYLVLWALIIINIIHPMKLSAENIEESEWISKEVPSEIQKIDAPFEMPQLKRPEFKEQIFNIVDYGAVGDGKKKNTKAFQRAIESCSSAGGGKVIVPKGRWFTGPIHLKSNVNLHLQKESEIHFSDNPEDYLPVVFTRWAGFELYNYSPLIYARDCKNIAITGTGKLFGNGQSWWSWEEKQSDTCLKVYHEQVKKNIPPEKRVYGTKEAGLRPQFINPVNCQNVLFEGFTVASPGPFWTFQILYCENVIVRDLKLHTVGGPNNDGINLDSTRNALVEYCWINSEDDALALKSGINEDGRRVGRPTENVVVRYISAYHCHGGAVIGSETSGDIRNIFVHDCEYIGSDRGIRLKSNASRGGVVERLWYENIKMKNIKYEAIIINTDYGAWIADTNGRAYPTFRDIVIKNVICDGARKAVSIKGTDKIPIHNITMENVCINADTGMRIEWVEDLKMEQVVSNPSKGASKVFIQCAEIVEN